MARGEQLGRNKLVRRIFITGAAASIAVGASLAGEASAKAKPRQHAKHPSGLTFVAPLANSYPMAQTPAQTPTSTTEASSITFVSPLPSSESPQPGAVPKSSQPITTRPRQPQPASPNIYYAPPHDMEKFFIAVNYNIAQIMHVDPARLNTKEKLIGELGWQRSEGGDDYNNSVNNPLNSGLYAPNLTAGWHDPSGLQRFVSFSAGVQATAISMTKPQYSRIPECLINPDCNAEQLVTTIVEYQYQNSKHQVPWAQADSDSNPKQQRYRVRLLRADEEYVRTHYNKVASQEMGTSRLEGPDNMHAEASTLIF